MTAYKIPVTGLMSGNNRAPPVVVGFFEGLGAPFAELLVSLAITTALKISDTVGYKPSYFYSLFGLIVVIDLVRHILIGLSRWQFAVGYLIGNIFGLFIFFGAINSISEEAANQSVLFAIALGVSYIVGIVVYLRSQPSSEDPSDW